MAAGVTVAIGLAVVGEGMAGLRWAHLYRQRTGEGIAFFQVGLQLVVGGVLALLGGCSLVAVGSRSLGPVRRLLLAAGWLVVVGLTVCAATALWVVGHGGRCIGTCG